MFFAAAVTLCIVGLQRNSKPAPPALKFDGANFVATVNGKLFKTTLVPLGRPVQTSTSKPLYRKDDAFVVWDARGLVMRKKDKLNISNLSGAPLSAKLWSRVEIAQNRVLLDVGGADPVADELLDHHRVGSEVYFLVRWRRPDGRVWFDAIVAVDLAAKSIAPNLIERFSETIAPVGKSSIGLTDNSVSVIERTETTWSIVDIPRKTKKPKRTTFDGNLESIVDLGGGLRAFVENTDYETQSGGTLDEKNAKKTNLVEAKGKIGFLPGPGTTVAWTRDAAALSLIDIESGAKLKLDPAGRFRRIGPYVVAWIEDKGPSEASLYDCDRWVRLATWKRTPTKAAKPKPVGN